MKKIIIPIFILMFVMFSINNKIYNNIYRKIDNSLSYAENDYDIKYDINFNRISINIELNDFEITKCKFSINNAEFTEVNIDGGHCSYSFKNLKEGTKYNIKIEFYDNNGIRDTLEKEVKTLTNFTDYIINLKNESLAQVGLYHHIDSLKSGAQDNSYRYSGKNINNWVCLGEEKECNPNNLYRIIGVFQDKKNEYHIKLVSYDYVNEDILGTDGNRYGFQFEFSPNKYYLGEKEKINTYYWYNNGNLNHSWDQSLLNTTNLNDNFYKKLENWKEIVLPADWWYIGKDINIDGTASDIFTKEITKNESSYNDEIGLMYASDYIGSFQK